MYHKEKKKIKSCKGAVAARCFGKRVFVGKLTFVTVLVEFIVSRTFFFFFFMLLNGLLLKDSIFICWVGGRRRVYLVNDLYFERWT